MKSRDYYDRLAKRYLPPGYKLEKLRMIQKLLAEKVREVNVCNLDEVDIVCGLDLAYVHIEDREYGIVCAVNYSIKEQKIVEHVCTLVEVSFPYIPTLLSLREMRPMIIAYKKLRMKPSVVLIDGHGKAHPYRLGIAAHFGVVMNVPTIGVAKSLLYGELRNCSEDMCDIVDEFGDVIGKALQVGKNYIYVSVGNLISLETAVKLVKKLMTPYSKMPIPILHAHNLCNRYKKEVLKNIKQKLITDFF